MSLGKPDVIKLWKRLQELEWRDYLARNGKGVFSIVGHPMATKLRKVVSNHFSGVCLDVGCGCLKKPVYMADGIEWYGIDPFAGNKKRDFKFEKGLAENLPYDDAFFDGVLFASSIDHLINPQLGLREAHRVLKSGGKLIVWYSRRGGVSYQKWKRRKRAAKYNEHHQWAFDDETMRLYVEKTGFDVEGIMKFGHKNRVLVGVKN